MAEDEIKPKWRPPGEDDEIPEITAEKKKKSVEDFEIVGTKTKALYVDQTPRKVYYDDYENELRYPFLIVDVTWAQVDEIINSCLRFLPSEDGGDPIPDLDIQKVQQQLFYTIVKDHPFPDPIETAYYCLSPKFRNWFSQFMPDLGLGLSQKDKGK